MRRRAARCPIRATPGDAREIGGDRAASHGGARESRRRRRISRCGTPMRSGATRICAGPSTMLMDNGREFDEARCAETARPLHPAELPGDRGPHHGRRPGRRGRPDLSTTVGGGRRRCRAAYGVAPVGRRRRAGSAPGPGLDARARRGQRPGAGDPGRWRRTMPGCSERLAELVGEIARLRESLEETRREASTDGLTAHRQPHAFRARAASSRRRRPRRPAAPSAW